MITNTWRVLNGMWQLTAEHLTTQIALHRVILGITDPKIIVDHKDHDGLNCQRSNLRITDHSGNMRNMRKHGTANGEATKSQYKGVTFHKRSGIWHAQIGTGSIANHKNHYLGSFESEIEAAKAYDVAAAQLFGEYAVLNFPPILRGPQ